MCGPLLAKESAWTVISVRGAKKEAGGHQAVTAAEAHLTDESGRSKDKWGARLEPYHHGGPHTELKPNPSKVKAEQQRFRRRHMSIRLQHFHFKQVYLTI